MLVDHYSTEGLLASEDNGSRFPSGSSERAGQVTSPSRRRGEGGFTIFEMLLVMGLIGIFVSIIIPDFRSSIPNVKVDKAASKLAADLRMAQQRAIEEMAHIYFVPDLSNNRYFAWVYDRENTWSDLVRDPLKGGSYLIVEYDQESAFRGVRLASARIPAGTISYLLFTPVGTLRFPTDTVTLTIQHTQTGYARSVQISRPMGRITVMP